MQLVIFFFVGLYLQIFFRTPPMISHGGWVLLLVLGVVFLFYIASR